MVSGYSQAQRRRMHWSSGDIVRNNAIANAMARDSFDEIMEYMHTNDNTKYDQDDKMTKLRPLNTFLMKDVLVFLSQRSNT